MAPAPVDVTVLRRLTACCCYGAISIMITLFNKAVFSVYRFPYPNVVTTYQIIISIAYMLLLRRLRWMDIGSFSLKSARQVQILAHPSALQRSRARPCPGEPPYAVHRAPITGTVHCLRVQGGARCLLPGACCRRCCTLLTHRVPAPDRTTAQVFPLTLFWWLYVVSGVIALRYLNVPMYRHAPCPPAPGWQPS